MDFTRKQTSLQNSENVLGQYTNKQPFSILPIIIHTVQWHHTYSSKKEVVSHVFTGWVTETFDVKCED